jgi:hypothetical protein
VAFPLYASLICAGEQLVEEIIGEALSRAFTIIGAKKLRMGFTVRIVFHKHAPLIVIGRALGKKLVALLQNRNAGLLHFLVLVYCDSAGTPALTKPPRTIPF